MVDDKLGLIGRIIAETPSEGAIKMEDLRRYLDLTGFVVDPSSVIFGSGHDFRGQKIVGAGDPCFIPGVNLEELPPEKRTAFFEKVVYILDGSHGLYHSLFRGGIEGVEVTCEGTGTDGRKLISLVGDRLESQIVREFSRFRTLFSPEEERKTLLRDLLTELSFLTGRPVIATYFPGDFKRELKAGFQGLEGKEIDFEEQRYVLLNFNPIAGDVVVKEGSLSDIGTDKMMDSHLPLTIDNQIRTFIANPYRNLLSERMVGFIGFEKLMDPTEALIRSLHTEEAGRKSILDVFSAHHSKLFYVGLPEYLTSYLDFQVDFSTVAPLDKRPFFRSMAAGKREYGVGILDLGGFGNMYSVLEDYLKIDDEPIFSKINERLSRIATKYDIAVKHISETGDQFLIFVDIDSTRRHDNLLLDGIKYVEECKWALRHLAAEIIDESYTQFLENNDKYLNHVRRLSKAIRTTPGDSYNELTKELSDLLEEIPTISYEMPGYQGQFPVGDNFSNLINFSQLDERNYVEVARELQSLLRNMLCLRYIATEGNQKDIDELSEIAEGIGASSNILKLYSADTSEISDEISTGIESRLELLKELYNGEEKIEEKLMGDTLIYSRRRLSDAQKYLNGDKASPKYALMHAFSTNELDKRPEITHENLALLEQEINDMASELKLNDQTKYHLAKERMKALDIKGALTQGRAQFAVGDNDTGKPIIWAARGCNEDTMKVQYHDRQMVIIPGDLKTIAKLTNEDRSQMVNFADNVAAIVKERRGITYMDDDDKIQKNADGRPILTTKETKGDIVAEVLSINPFCTNFADFTEILGGLVNEDSALYKLKDLISTSREEVSDILTFTSRMMEDYSHNLGLNPSATFFNYLTEKFKNLTVSFRGLVEGEKNEQDRWDSNEYDKTCFWRGYNTAGALTIATSALSFLMAMDEQNLKKSHSLFEKENEEVYRAGRDSIMSGIDGGMDSLEAMAHALRIIQLAKFDEGEQYFFDHPNEIRTNTIQRQIKESNKKTFKGAVKAMNSGQTSKQIESLLDGFYGSEDGESNELVYFMKLTDEYITRARPQPYVGGEPEQMEDIFGKEMIEDGDNKGVYTDGLFARMEVDIPVRVTLAFYATLSPINKGDDGYDFVAVQEDGTFVFDYDQINKQIKYNIEQQEDKRTWVRCVSPAEKIETYEDIPTDWLEGDAVHRWINSMQMYDSLGYNPFTEEDGVRQISNSTAVIDQNKFARALNSYNLDRSFIVEAQALSEGPRDHDGEE